jgi:importin subunit beta-1
LKTPSWLLDL